MPNNRHAIYERIMFGGVLAAMLLLFVAISQPAWRGNQMLAEMKANCDKVGGVMLESKGLLGNTYECSPRYDKGVIDAK